MNSNNARGSYDVRTYTLTANIPQALPSAREFLIISATDITAIGFNLGDSNGDFELWPFGFAIGVKEGSTRARIQSTITQTVTVAMIDGDVTVKDNRFAPGAGSLPVTEADGANVTLGAKADAAATTDAGAFSLIALMKRLLGKTNVPDAYTTSFRLATVIGAPANATVQVAAGGNTNGILLYTATVACLHDPTAEARLIDNGVGYIDVIDGQCASISGPILIPAGQQLALSYTGGVRASGCYRLL